MTTSMDHLHEIEAAGVRWRVLPGWEERLLGPHGLRLDEWLDQGRAQVVKEGPHRTVYRVRLADVCFYLKHYRLADLGARLRRYLQPVKACREFQQALAVAERSVSTVAPVALGERRTGAGAGESFFITQGLEQVHPLGRFLEEELPLRPEPARSVLRQTLAQALGEFLARMHAAGIAHHDLHTANIMVRIEAAGPIFFLLDLDAVRVAAPLAWPASSANLALFNRYFILRANRTDRARFWRAYCRTRDMQASSGSGIRQNYGILGRPVTTQDASLPIGILANSATTRFTDALPLTSNWLTGWPGLSPRSPGLPRGDGVFSGASKTPPRPLSNAPGRFGEGRLATQLEADTWRSNIAFWTRRDRRCLRTNRYYYRFQHGPFIGHAAAGVSISDLECLLNDPERALSAPGVRLLKNSPSSQVALLTVQLGGRNCQVVLKRFAVRRWSDPLAAIFRPTPALRSWINGNGLRERYVPTARPLAVWQRRAGGLTREGYLLTEYVPDSCDLHVRLRNLTQTADVPGLRLEIESVARLVRTLHERQLSQRDLKATNILTGPRGPVLIDLVGVRSPRQLGLARRVQNLARLHASFRAVSGLTRTDKLRFLRTYMNWGLRGRSGWKEWLRRIDAATCIKAEQNQRRGRPLA